jgi:hypothetical protein
VNEDGKIILFPKDRIVKKDNVGPKGEKFSKQVEKQQTIQFVESAVDDIALDLLKRCVDLAMRTNTEVFTKDFAYLVDAMRSMIKRDFGLNHVVQKVVDSTVQIDVSPKGEQIARIDYSKIYDTKAKSVKNISDITDEAKGGIEFIPDFDLDPPNNDN